MAALRDVYRCLSTPAEWAVLATARVLPWLELAIGLLLLTGLALPYVSLIASVILAVFFGIMALSFGKGMGIDCGCFGVGEALTAKSLARDGALLSSAIVLCVMAFRRISRRDRFS